MHRRFDVVAGAQAQVDWGEQGDVLARVVTERTYSSHMTLSSSRNRFTCFTSPLDLATFWDGQRQPFAHFGGVPGSIVYDRPRPSSSDTSRQARPSRCIGRRRLSTRRSKALAALCTETSTRYPDANLPLDYSVKGYPEIN